MPTDSVAVSVFQNLKWVVNCGGLILFVISLCANLLILVPVWEIGVGEEVSKLRSSGCLRIDKFLFIRAVFGLQTLNVF